MSTDKWMFKREVYIIFHCPIPLNIVLFYSVQKYRHNKQNLPVSWGEILKKTKWRLVVKCVSVENKSSTSFCCIGGRAWSQISNGSTLSRLVLSALNAETSTFSHNFLNTYFPLKFAPTFLSFSVLFVKVQIELQNLRQLHPRFFWKSKWFSEVKSLWNKFTFFFLNGRTEKMVSSNEFACFP